MWFEGQWMQLEDIALGEVSQAQKDKGPRFSLICGRQIQRINIYTKTSMITHKLIHVRNNGASLWNSEKEGKEKRMMEHQ
jgi:hypothetical protein